MLKTLKDLAVALQICVSELAVLDLDFDGYQVGSALSETRKAYASVKSAIEKLTPNEAVPDVEFQAVLSIEAGE